MEGLIAEPEGLRVLVVCFYFPPAGGGGVQRILKTTEHLVRLGFSVDVLAPDDPRWLYRDEGLAVPEGVRVHRAHYPGPAARRPADELYAREGLSRLARRAALQPRRLLVPDEHVGWVPAAAWAARRIVRERRIDLVLSSSPPSSVHLVGAAVQAATGVAWVADLRDSIVAKNDRRLERRLVRWKELSHRAVARLVASRADGIVCVTPTLAREMLAFGPRLEPAVVPNGSDFEDFDGLVYRGATQLRVTHTGTFFGTRTARPFLEGVLRSGVDLRARFAGGFPSAERDWALQHGLGERLDLMGPVSRARALELQRDSEVLLLLLPEIGERGRDVPSGKVFEYLAAGRPILACVPPNGSAAALIERCRAGIVVPPDDADAIAAALQELDARWRAGQLQPVELPEELRWELSRERRVEELAAWLLQVAGAKASPVTSAASAP